MNIEEASKLLGFSQWTIRRRIKNGILDAKMVGGRYNISEESVAAYAQARQNEQMLPNPANALMMEFQRQIDRLEKENDQLRKELSDVRERSDMIIMQLTHQLEQNQKLLEYHQNSFWRRWFGRRRSTESEHA